MDNEIKGKIIGCVKTNDGTEYAFFDDGSICEIIAPGQYKKVNDIIDKNDFLKNKILNEFNNRHNSDVITSDRKNKLVDKVDKNDEEYEELELPDF